MVGRPFRKTEDVRSLQAFLAEMRHQVSQAAYFQFGDLVWRMHYPPNGFDATRDVRVWEREDGRVEGFVFYFTRDDNPEFFLRPEQYDSRMADEMVAWAVARSRECHAPSIDTSCIDGDARKAAFLSQAGFQPIDDVMVFMERALSDPLPACPLSPGYSIVSALDRPDLAGVARSTLTPDEHAIIYQAPGYRDDLGLRVCCEDRAIVAGCICWYDDIDNCGEFEPVGTKEAHRRKGLASAVITRTMENLRRYGADKVYVRTNEENVLAVRLYQKLGFRITHEDHGWRRPTVRS